MDDDSLSKISTLTDGQEITLSLLSICSGSLSLLGSSTIVYKVLHNTHKTSPYDRIMFVLSCCDIVASVCYATAPFLLPKDTSQRVWASGSDATCNILGFFYQFAFSAIWYNGVLSFYYLLTVRFGVKRQYFADHYELPLHAISLLFFVGTATAGATLGFFSELKITQACWIGEYPEGCEARGDCKGSYIGWAFAGLPTLVVFISIIVNNIVIFVHVRKRLGGSSEGLGLEPTIMGSERAIRQRMHIREVAWQGFLYVGTFLVAYLVPFILRVLESLGLDAADEASIYALLFLDALLRPLQGFFNMFVYNRPNYVRVRAAYPELSKAWAIRIACFDSDIPRLLEATRFSTMRATSKNSNTGRGGSKRGTPLGSRFSSNLAIMREEPKGSSTTNHEDEEKVIHPQPPRRQDRLPPPSGIEINVCEELPNAGAMMPTELDMKEDFEDDGYDEQGIPLQPLAGRRISMDGSIDSFGSIEE